MKKRWLLPIAVMMLCCIASCGSENMGNPGVESGNEPDVEKKDLQEIAQEPLKPFSFQTPEDVENLSDEDLLCIATHGYKQSDFLEYDPEQKIDLFDIPLAEWEWEGIPRKEEITPCVLRSARPLEEMDLGERIPDEEFMGYAREYCERMITSQERWDESTGTGTRVKDSEIIYCGATDNYVEYSVRLTEVSSYISDGKLKTSEMPLAYRMLFDRNRIWVSAKDRGYEVYLGEYTLEKMKAEQDFWFANGAGSVLYREFSETDTELIYTEYSYGISVGDYGMYDRAYLMKTTTVYHKRTHETTVLDSYEIKEVDIPGTYKSWGGL